MIDLVCVKANDPSDFFLFESLFMDRGVGI